jgi:hypothetical protein
VLDSQAHALQERGGDRAEVLRASRAALGLEDADALHHFFPRVLAAEDRAQAHHHRR